MFRKTQTGPFRALAGTSTHLRVRWSAPVGKSYGPVTRRMTTVGANSKELVEIAGTQRALLGRLDDASSRTKK